MEPTHYIFVDYENVQNINLDLIPGKPVKVILVLGKKQTTLPVGLVKKLMEHSSQVRMVDTEAVGKNALDFVLACVAGEQSAADPDGHFFIVSRDQGFEALVLYLRRRHRKVERHEAFAAVPILGGLRIPVPAAAGPSPQVPKKKVKSPALTSLDERVKFIRDLLTAQTPANRPKSQKALLSLIGSHFGKKLTAREIQSVFDKLAAQHVIEIQAGKAVHYNV